MRLQYRDWSLDYLLCERRSLAHGFKPLLSMMQDGGNKTIRFQSSYGYGNTLNFHFSNQGKEGVAQQAVPLFNGGGFNEEYNSRYEPLRLRSQVTQHA